MTDELKKDLEEVLTFEDGGKPYKPNKPMMNIASDQNALIKLDFNSDNTLSRKKILDVKIEKELWDNCLSKWEKIVLKIVFQLFPGFKLTITD